METIVAHKGLMIAVAGVRINNHVKPTPQNPAFAAIELPAFLVVFFKSSWG